MWRIQIEIEGEGIPRIASYNTNPKDEIDIKLSMFRGPNRIIWYCREPDINLLSSITPYNNIYFSINDQGGLIWDIKCQMTYFGWNAKKECMEIIFVPKLYNILNTVSEFYLEDVTTIDKFVESMVGEDYSYSVSDDIKNYKIFSNLSVKGKPLDVLCDVAEQYNFEVYCTGSSIGFGRVLADGMDEEDVNEVNLFNNSYGVYQDIYGNKYTSVSTSYALYLPGGYIKFHGQIKRIVYLSIQFTHFKDPKSKLKIGHEQDVAPTCTAICIDKDNIATEEMLYNLLPEEDKHYLRNIKKYNYPSFVSIMKEEDDITKKVYPNLMTDDLANVVAMEGETLKVAKTSPYAGDEVGLQFPTQEQSVDLIIKHRNRTHAALSVNQLWSDEIPERSSLDDFRFTLPEGTTEYYSKENNEWMFGSKGTIKIGYWENASYDSIPAIDKNYIEIDSDSLTIVVNNKKLVITSSGLEIDGDLKVKGNTELDGTVDISGITTHGATIT